MGLEVASNGFTGFSFIEEAQVFMVDLEAQVLKSEHQGSL